MEAVEHKNENPLYQLNNTKKRINASELLKMGILFPSLQRKEIQEHTEQIVEFQRKERFLTGHFLFLGCISICVYKGKHYIGKKNNPKNYCIDGQHRYHAIEILYREINEDFPIDIELIYCETEKEMTRYFKNINLNKPVPEFLQTAVEGGPLTRLREYIITKYSNFISKSERPQRPNINIDIFVQKMNEKYAIDQRFSTYEEAVEWFERENANHGEYLKVHSSQSQIDKILDRIEKNVRTRHGSRFYLGTYWLDTLKNKLNGGQRKKVWFNWFRSLPDCEKNHGEPLCPCCEAEFINALAFEAGHKTSFKNGGTDALDNLIPICGGCNRSMGIMDFAEYKQSLC